MTTTLTNSKFLGGPNLQRKDAKSIPVAEKSHAKAPETPSEVSDSGPILMPNIPNLGASGPSADAQRRVSDLTGRLRSTTRHRLELVARLASPSAASVDLDHAARELLAGNELVPLPAHDDREKLRAEVAQAERVEQVISRAIALLEGEAREARRREEASVTAAVWPYCRRLAKRLLEALGEVAAVGKEVDTLVERAGRAGVSSARIPMADLEFRKPVEELLARLVNLGLIADLEAPRLPPPSRPAPVQSARTRPMAAAQFAAAAGGGELCEDQSW